jgi:TonB family protein
MMFPNVRSQALVCAGTFLILAATAAASDWKPPGAHHCPRKFSDEQIDQILKDKLKIDYDHRLTVNYTKCHYYMAIWPLPIVVDSNILIDLDEDGNLPPVVVKYGIRGNTNENVSYRKISKLTYPPSALNRRISGIVLVRVSIAPDATVSAASIVQVSPRDAGELTEGLVDAIRTWRFNPLTQYGNQLSSDVLVPVRFTITNRPLPSWSNRKLDMPKGVPWLETIEVSGEATETE